MNPLENGRFRLTIWCATRITEEPHAAPAPLNPSSMPSDFFWPGRKVDLSAIEGGEEEGMALLVRLVDRVRLLSLIRVTRSSGGGWVA